MFWSRVLALALLPYIALIHPPVILPEWGSEVQEALGLVLLATAAFGRIWCLLFVAGKKDAMLVMDGPYSVVRNPLYVFSFIGTVGFGLAVNNLFLAAGLALTFAAYYSYVVRGEERFLASAFAPHFQAYADSTPRWWPRFSQYQEPKLVSVSPERIRAGILDAMWFIWAFVIWELLEALHQW